MTKNLNASETFVRDHLVTADLGFPVLTLLAALGFVAVTFLVDLNPPSMHAR